MCQYLHECFGHTSCNEIQWYHCCCSKYDDSKVLSSGQREALFDKIQSDEKLAFATVSMAAQEISSSMLATSRMTLNEMAAQATLQLIECCLSKKINVTAVRSDTQA